MENNHPAGPKEEVATFRETAKTKTVQLIGLTQELTNALIIYLESKPFREVNGMLQALSKSQAINVTVPDGE